MKTILNALLATVVLLISGCATVSHDEILAQANAVGYGADLAPGWEEKIKSFMEFNLKDPTSAQYKFGQPEKGWLTKPPIQGGGLDVTGYLVHVAINAKNSFGGYTGYKEYRFILRDNQVVAFGDFSSGIGFMQKVR